MISSSAKSSLKTLRKETPKEDHDEASQELITPGEEPGRKGEKRPRALKRHGSTSTPNVESTIPHLTSVTIPAHLDRARTMRDEVTSFSLEGTRFNEPSPGEEIESRPDDGSELNSSASSAEMASDSSLLVKLLRNLSNEFRQRFDSIEISMRDTNKDVSGRFQSMDSTIEQQKSVNSNLRGSLEKLQSQHNKDLNVESNMTLHLTSITIPAHLDRTRTMRDEVTSLEGMRFNAGERNGITTGWK